MTVLARFGQAVRALSAHIFHVAFLQTHPGLQHNECLAPLFASCC